MTPSQPPSEATDSAAPVHVAVSLKDGSRLVGQLDRESLIFHSRLAGELKIPLQQIQAIQWEDRQSAFVLTTVHGEKLQGNLTGAIISLKTVFGNMAIPLAQVTQLQVEGEAPSAAGWLMCRWSAEGNAKDSAGGHDGELMNGGTYTEGKFGQAFRFDGQRSRVHIPDSPDFESIGSYTIEAWIVVTALPPADGAGCICARGDRRAGLDTWILGIQPNGDMNFSFNSADNRDVHLFAPIPEKQWCHIAAVYDDAKGTMAIYVDGKLGNSMETKLKPIRRLDASQSPGIEIGNASGGHIFPFEGLVDELGIWTKALTAEEIRAIYAKGSQ